MYMGRYASFLGIFTFPGMNIKFMVTASLILAFIVVTMIIVSQDERPDAIH